MSAVTAAFLAWSLAQAVEPLTLEIRVFRGTEDVTAQSRVTLHRAGERAHPVGRTDAGSGSAVIKVAPGIYDAQAIHEKDGRVIGIRWAERLVVMPYPDEGGHHLEVINLDTGFGALQVRSAPGSLPPDRIVLVPGNHDADPRERGDRLFVVPAGRYDIQVTRGRRASVVPGVEVPLDRTRLWIVP